MNLSATRSAKTIRYPRRRLGRWFLQKLSWVAFLLVGRVNIQNLENIPTKGPVILAANHFHFSDPVAMLCTTKRQVEFVGGFRFPNAPMIVKFLPYLWGYLPVKRGGYSRASLEYAQAVLDLNGVVGIFPEGGAWAKILRYPRPGIGFLAANSNAQIVPIGLSGFTHLFKSWRPVLTVRVGKPIGPFVVEGEGRVARQQSDEIGVTVMRAIAELLPDEERGVYSECDATRSLAETQTAYPFEQKHMRGM